jgi:hypothetical protein
MNLFMPMKNVFLLLAVCCTLLAQASSYNYLVFTNISGAKTAFGVSNLTLKVEGTDLKVTNTNGTVNLVLTDLASMQFSNDDTTTRLDNVLNADTDVQVFSVSGATIGSYHSLMEAVQILEAGVYVISNGSVTQTIVVK